MPTVTIPLSQGKTSIIDDEDADLAAVKWCAMRGLRGPFYAVRHVYRNGGQKKFVLHRVILERKLGRPLVKGEFVDHINGDGLDNRRSNLRLATCGQNRANQWKRANNTSGYHGVNWVSRERKWRAEITVSGKRITIGYFDDPVEAHQAYRQASLEHFGEFSPYADEANA